MDPGLWELCEAGSDEDEVSVIIRLKDEATIPPDVRVISQFGKIITTRLQRGGIQRIHDSEEVASMKASWSLGEGVGLYDNELAESLAGSEFTHPSYETDLVSFKEDGSDVTVGICDWGFDFTHENFRNADGTTRLLTLWDQGAEDGEAPMPYGYGRVYTREQINHALTTPDPTSSLGYHPSKGDPRGNGAHGTHVADILAGNKREPGSEVGLASASEIIFVHLATQRLRALENFGDSVRLLEGLDFVRKQAGENPLVAHFSAGKTGGSHDGTALFEQAVDALVVERPGIALVQSVGNYAASRMHSHGRIGPDQKHVLHWLISSRDRTPNELEIWYSGKDNFELALVAPNGARFVAPLGENVKLIQNGTRWGTLYHRQGEPNSGMNHVDIVLRTTSPSGRYHVELGGRDVVDGRFQAWIERDAGGRHQSHFTRKQATSEYTTNTICNSYRGIAVGAYDATATGRPATRFTSRGTTADGRVKPEVAAPGHRIRAARSLPADGWNGESRLTVKSGTSMAAPFVSGTVALMMQAAGRPLTIAEVRRVLIGTVDPLPGRSGRSHTRLGYGYLNTAAAVEAARKLGRNGSTEQQVYEEEVTFGGEAPDESWLDWAPRWVVDPQPFEVNKSVTESEDTNYQAVDPGVEFITETDETRYESGENDAAIIETTVQSSDDGTELFIPVEDDHVLAGDDFIYEEEQDREDWRVEKGDEAEFEPEDDRSVIDDTTVLPDNHSEIFIAAEDDSIPLTDDFSHQEEEENEANRLTELYEVLEELAQGEQIEN